MPSSLIPQTSSLGAAPMRLLLAFLAQKNRLLAALRDEGGLFEIRLLSRWAKREQDAVTLASAEADTLKIRATTLRQKVMAALSPADDTPGHIDPKEAQELLTDLATLGRHATTHATHLNRLV